MNGCVEYTNGFFILELSGIAETEAFGVFFDELLAHEEWKPGAPWLADITKLDAGRLTINDVQRIASLSVKQKDRYGRGKAAVLADRDLEFGLSRIWTVFVEGQWDVDTDIFRSREEAIAWLLA